MAGTREQIQASKRRLSDGRRDIGPVPAIVNPERRDACEFDLRLYLETYHAEDFVIAWSDSHLKLIEVTQDAIQRKLQQIIAYPRGSGKTMIARRAIQWAINYGKIKHGLLFGAEASKSKQHIESIKRSYLTNPLLLEDFPELVYPITESEGIANRANYQTSQGKPTGLRWGANIIFPDVPAAAERGNNGSVISVGTITGSASRGPLVNGHRPDFAFIDDPQTRRSAKSPGQIKERADSIRGDIMGMAGPGKAISCVITATVIYKDDLADQFLDKQANPEWNGVRFPMVIEFPKKTKLWDQWNDVRKACLIDDRDLAPAHKFYEEHRKEMDEGAKVYWEGRINRERGYVSAIETAMGLYYEDPEIFAAEYQNDPASFYESESVMPAVKDMQVKVHRARRRQIPQEATKLTAFIDVQGKILYYWVMAFSQDFSGFVVDYGTFPDQNRLHFTLYDAKATFFRKYPGHTFHGACYRALHELMDQLEGTDWAIHGSKGQTKNLDIGLIDAQYGDSTDTVYKVCRERGANSPWLPSHGKGHGAKSRPFSEYKKQPGDQIGPNWRIPAPARTKRKAKHITYETNFWKTFTAHHWAVPLNETGSYSFFWRKARHTMVAQHHHAERCIEVEANGRRVLEWLELPSKPDNHFFDCCVGCTVAASVEGCTEPALEARSQPRRRSRKRLTSKMVQEKVASWST